VSADQKQQKPVQPFEAVKHWLFLLSRTGVEPVTFGFGGRPIMSQRFMYALVKTPRFMRYLTENEALFVRRTLPDSTCFPNLYQAFSDSSRTVLGQLRNRLVSNNVPSISLAHSWHDRCGPTRTDDLRLETFLASWSCSSCVFDAPNDNPRESAGVPDSNFEHALLG